VDESNSVLGIRAASERGPARYHGLLDRRRNYTFPYCGRTLSWSHLPPGVTVASLDVVRHAIILIKDIPTGWRGPEYGEGYYPGVGV